jgi:hypothetical protein
MERCALQFQLPDLENTATNSSRSLLAHASPVVIDIWRLNTKQPIRASQLSLSSRPARQKLLFPGVEVYLGVNHTTLPFDCASDSLQTFEAVCSDRNADCALSFWQARTHLDSGASARLRNQLSLMSLLF